MECTITQKENRQLRLKTHHGARDAAYKAQCSPAYAHARTTSHTHQDQLNTARVGARYRASVYHGVPSYKRAGGTGLLNLAVYHSN